jgi:hypothetical protein
VTRIDFIDNAGERYMTVNGVRSEYTKASVEFSVDKATALIIDGRRVDPPFTVLRNGHLLVRGLEDFDVRRG